MDNEYYDLVLHTFKMFFPAHADDMESWTPRGDHGIRVKLNDGSEWDYNYRMNTIRIVKEYDGSEDSWKREFTNRLIDQMALRGFDQTRLSEASGISHASISGYIHRKKIPTAFAIDKLARALGCDVSDLVGFD